jgi:hypothetical protein
LLWKLIEEILPGDTAVMRAESRECDGDRPNSVICPTLDEFMARFGAIRLWSILRRVRVPSWAAYTWDFGR